MVLSVYIIQSALFVSSLPSFLIDLFQLLCAPRLSPLTLASSLRSLTCDLHIKLITAYRQVCDSHTMQIT